MPQPKIPSRILKLRGYVKPCDDVGVNWPTGHVDPPSDVKGAALQEWKRMAPLLIELGLLTAASRNAFARLCRAEARRIRLQKLVDRQGDTIGTGKSRRASPLARLLGDAEKQQAEMEREFGMTPTSSHRARSSSALPRTTNDENSEDIFTPSRKIAPA